MSYNQSNPNSSNKLSGGIVYNTRIITGGTDSTILNNDYILQIDVAGLYSINLPSNPVSGRTVIIAGGSVTSAINILTISGNGKNIEGLSLKTIVTAYGKHTLCYNGTEWLSLSLI